MADRSATRLKRLATLKPATDVSTEACPTFAGRCTAAGRMGVDGTFARRILSRLLMLVIILNNSAQIARKRTSRRIRQSHRLRLADIPDHNHPARGDEV